MQTFISDPGPIQATGRSDAPDDIAYAGFGVRFFAFIIDSLIKLIVVFILRMRLSGALSYNASYILSRPLLFSYTVIDIAAYLAGSVYFILFTYLGGATVGKLLLKLRVISVAGDRPGLIDVVYRETIGRYLSSLMLIGYVYAAISRRKQGFHDMLADTCVVYSIKPNYAPPAGRRHMHAKRRSPGSADPDTRQTVEAYEPTDLTASGSGDEQAQQSPPDSEPEPTWPYWDRR